MGPRPAPGPALEPPPRSARRRVGRLRHARQDVQGPDRRAAGVADRAPARARDAAAPPRPSTSTRSSSSRSRSTASRRARATRAASRCASRACCATAPDKRPDEADTIATVRTLHEARAGGVSLPRRDEQHAQHRQHRPRPCTRVTRSPRWIRASATVTTGNSELEHGRDREQLQRRRDRVGEVRDHVEHADAGDHARSPRRSTRTLTRRTRTTMRDRSPARTTRSTNGAQYGSTAEAREKITSSVPSSTAASTAKPMPRRPRAWPSPRTSRRRA